MARYVIDNRPAAIDFEQRDAEARVVQRAKNLLMLQTGEVPYDRYRGVSAELNDLPISTVRDMLLEEIDRVLLWEPMAEAVSAEADIDADGKLYISVVIQVGEEDESR